MDSLAAAVLESWNRNCEIVDRLVESVDESLMDAKPSEDGWTIAGHLCHMHDVRWGWLSDVSSDHAARLGKLYLDGRFGDQPTRDLGLIRSELRKSGEAIADAVRGLLGSGAMTVGPYSHPLHFMQHMVWHDGWHYGLIALAKRLAGREPSEEWEEENVWAIWRS